MKKTKFIIAVSAILTFMASVPAFAQEDNGFKKFNVKEDFTENGFQWFHDAELLAAGDKDKSNAMTIGWVGMKSGRDGDRSATQGDACPDKKAQALGLHTAYTANGTPYYTEAAMVIECKIMYAAPFDPQYFKSDAPKRMYARSAEGRSQGENFPAGIHSMYIGEVVNAWKK